jgi:hypothetical protein
LFPLKQTGWLFSRGARKDNEGNATDQYKGVKSEIHITPLKTYSPQLSTTSQDFYDDAPESKHKGQTKAVHAVGLPGCRSKSNGTAGVRKQSKLRHRKRSACI